jgi:uncharacterized iron-regulated membrane protein
VSAELVEGSQPRTRVRTRRLLLRVHLWIALGLGAYLIVISLSGSAVVFRRELNQWLVPRTVASTEGERLTGDALVSAVEATYPDDVVVEVREPQRPERPVFVALDRGGVRTDRLFDPYAVADLGETFPPALRAVEWLVDLHDNLLAGQTGRLINGIGGMLFTTLILSGVWLWWPGLRNLARSLRIGKPQATRRFLFQLHSVLGILSFALLFVWGITAIYFAFPEPFERTIDYFDDDLNDLVRPGEPVLLQLIRWHFGRFGGLGVRFLWVVLGLLPVVLFVTGFVLWWTRADRRRSAAMPS